MKKSLICLAVLGLSAAAHAQSSVTLAGTVDTMLSRGTGSVADRTQLGSGGNATSKLIIRGIEDLGGGMAGYFHLETGFLADHGAFQATTTNNQPSGTATAPAGTQGLTFNRRAIVGLRSAWGEVQLGRNWAPMYDAFTGRYDPFGVSVGLALNYAASFTSADGAVRRSNMVTYITPQFAGFTANIAHWFGENPSGTATSRDGTGNGIRLEYDKGPISARAHWGRTNFAAADVVYRAVAGSYNFGPVKVSANYVSDKQGSVERKGPLVGVRVPVGVGEFKASYSAHRNNVGGGDQKARKLAIGYVHNLSKRTAVYTTFARVTNKGGSRLALAGATTAANASSNGFDIGIRHNF